VIDKPAGCTSHDIVNRVRRLAGTRRVGHLGTLDPLATGVLPLMIGRATRLARFLEGGTKRYQTLIHFGWSTSTYDREGEKTSEPAEPNFPREDLELCLNDFRGTFEQTPPPVSAKKIGGVPAYKLVRKHVSFELKPVQVTVHSLDLDSFDGVTARISLHCSSGTYVRAIAHDLGQRLGCGAFVDALRRIASGDFIEEQARTLDELARLAEEQRLAEAVIPGAQLLPQFPSEFVDVLTEGQIRQGRDFRVSPFRVKSGSRYVKALSRGGELIAIGEAKLPHLFHPVLVM